MRVNAYEIDDDGQTSLKARNQLLTSFFNDAADYAKAYDVINKHGRYWVQPGTPVQFLLERCFSPSH